MPAATTSHTDYALTALRGRWTQLAPREQMLVAAAGVLVLLALLWWVALAPALQTLRSAPARHAALDAELQRMLQLQAEARQLQALPQASAGDAAAQLRSSLAQRLGAQAQISVAGDRATVQLKGASADGLAQWLAQVRSNARAVPLEMRLSRSSAAGNAAAADSPRWDGTIVLGLPAAR